MTSGVAQRLHGGRGRVGKNADKDKILHCRPIRAAFPECIHGYTRHTYTVVDFCTFGLVCTMEGYYVKDELAWCGGQCANCF